MEKPQRLELKRGKQGWAVYLPEHQELFGTGWIPLPFTAEASEEYVRTHCLLFQEVEA
mgnify:CR=1 FL=1